MPGQHKPHKPNGNSVARMRADEEAFRDNAILTTSCAFCKWSYEGTALEGRELAKGHRRAEHPELKPAKRQRSSLQRFSGQKQSEWRRDGLANAAEVAAMIRRREEAA